MNADQMIDLRLTAAELIEVSACIESFVLAGGIRDEIFKGEAPHLIMMSAINRIRAALGEPPFDVQYKRVGLN